VSPFPRASLGECVEPSDEVVVVEHGVRYPNAGILNRGRGLFVKPELDGSDTSYRTLNVLRADDFVYSRLFGWEGAVAVVPEAFDGYHVSAEFPVLRARPDVVIPDYLGCVARWPDFHVLLADRTTGLGNRRQRVPLDRFLSVEVPLPPIEDQRRVVRYIDSLTKRADRVAFLAKRDELLALVTAPAIVDAILSRFATERTHIGDLAELVNDLVRPGDDPSPASAFVGLQHVESHSGRRIGEAPVGGEKGRKFRFRPGDILYGYLRPYLNKVWVADRDGLCSVDQHVLRPKGDVPAEYIAYALRSRSTLDEAIRLTHSLQLPRLRSGLLLDLEIPVPAPSEISAALSQLDSALARVLQLDSAFRRRRVRIDALGVSALNHAFAGLA